MKHVRLLALLVASSFVDTNGQREEPCGHRRHPGGSDEVIRVVKRDSVSNEDSITEVAVANVSEKGEPTTSYSRRVGDLSRRRKSKSKGKGKHKSKLKKKGKSGKFGASASGPVMAPAPSRDEPSRDVVMPPSGDEPSSGDPVNPPSRDEPSDIPAESGPPTLSPDIPVESGPPTVSPDSGPPTESPGIPTETNQPTETPTPIPTTESPIPDEDFDISDCESYALEWLLDLADTCENIETFEGCECTTAAELVSDGTIVCETAVCPDDCEVCIFCVEDTLCA